jgi:hypothetical protein
MSLTTEEREALMTWLLREWPYDGYVLRCVHCQKQRTDGHARLCPLPLVRKLIVSDATED